jgi:hypothetical protein
MDSARGGPDAGGTGPPTTNGGPIRDPTTTAWGKHAAAVKIKEHTIMVETPRFDFKKYTLIC